MSTMKAGGIGFLIGLVLAGVAGIAGSANLWMASRAAATAHEEAVSSITTERDELRAQVDLLTGKQTLWQTDGMLCDTERDLWDQNFGSARTKLTAAVAKVGVSSSSEAPQLSDRLQKISLAPGLDTATQVRDLRAASAAVREAAR